MISINLKRRGGTVIWDHLSLTAQNQKNENRRAMGMQRRAVTATWDEVQSPERTMEDEHVLAGSGA